MEQKDYDYTNLPKDLEIIRQFCGESTNEVIDAARKRVAEHGTIIERAVAEIHKRYKCTCECGRTITMHINGKVDD